MRSQCGRVASSSTGCQDFRYICESFLKTIDTTPNILHRRGAVEVLRDSVNDKPRDKDDGIEYEVRYKLIIDPSEDESLVRLLFTFGVLKRENTRIYVCSDFPGDGEIQKINTISNIRYSTINGHTVVMTQTDDIHESFYDLFNQHFRRIDSNEGKPHYYTNIAIGPHLKPSRVHSKFQCLVVIKKSEVLHTPSPFLNRFEKYLVSYSSLIDTAFENMPPNMAIMLKNAIAKVSFY